MGGGVRRIRRFVLGALVCVCVIFWFMFLLAISNHRHRHDDHQTSKRRSGTVVNGVPFSVISKHLELIGMGRRHHRRPNSGMINYVSKRRVPNGPDPIHNRRAVNSRQPPTRT